MNIKLNIAQLLAAAAALFAGGCLVAHQEMIKTIDRSVPMENSRLWRQVKSAPAAYVPRALPAGARTGPGQGKWIEDPQDHVSFFVPRAECGHLSPGIWEGEAMKATNRYSLEGQKLKNTKTLLVRWPFEAMGNALVAYGQGMGGSSGVNSSYGSRGGKH